MKLKLLKNLEKKRYEREAWSAIEQHIEEFDAEKSSPEWRTQITRYLLAEIKKLNIRGDDFGLDQRKLRVIKKFEANILAGGGFQNIEPSQVSAFLKFVLKVNNLNWKDSALKDEVKEVVLMYKAVVESELQSLLKADRAYVDENDREDKLKLLWDTLGNDLTMGGNLKNSRLVFELLKRDYDIDFSTGKNLQETPPEIVNKVIYAYLDKLYSYKLSSEGTKSRDVLSDFVNNYISGICDKYKDNPEKILLACPAIMELYNFSYSQSTDENSKEASENVAERNTVRKIIELLPRNIPISDEEMQFMEKASQKYLTQKMPGEELLKYESIYLKMLTNEITQCKSRKMNLMKYSDILLGQMAMGNPEFSNGSYASQINKENLFRILYYDYSKDLVNEYIQSSEYRISMRNEYTETRFAGLHNSGRKDIRIIPFQKNERAILVCIETIYHEVQHAFIYDCQTTGVQTGVLQYLANKASVLRMYVPNLVEGGEFNYMEYPHEISARLRGMSGAISFMEKHGVENEKITNSINSRINEDNQREKHADTMDNPEYNLSWGGAITGIKRDMMKVKLFDRNHRQKIFKLKKYLEYKRYERHADFDGSRAVDSDYVSLLDGGKINIDKIFDRIIKDHPELCQEGSYFSIEYNPDGKRKTTAEILSQLSQLDESESSDQKREVYKHILLSGIIENDVPSQAFKALFNYQSTNQKNDEIIKEIVQKKLLGIVKGMTNEYLNDNVLSLSMKYMRTGYDRANYMAPGYTFNEKLSSVIDKIVARCEEEEKGVEEGKKMSPFVEGVFDIAPGSSYSTNGFFDRFNPPMTVLTSLKKYQEKVQQYPASKFYLEVLGGYVISVADIAKLALNPMVKRVANRFGSKTQPTEAKDAESNINDNESR